MLASTTARRLAAVLFADITGFTRLTAENEDAAYTLAAELQGLARELAAKHGGRFIRSVGDSVLVEFPSAAAAVGCALELDRSFSDRSAARGAPASLHIGVHAGEVMQAPDGDVYGEAVNLAARLQGVAAPGQVLVSDDVRRQLRARSEFAFVAAGTHALKGIAEPVTVHVAQPPDAALAPGAAGAGEGTAPGLVSGAAGPHDSMPTTRLIVLPFRILRADPETDFLSFSLADAIASSLSGLRSLIVRSQLTALGLAETNADLRTISREADVDLVLAGSLLRAGDRLRVTTHLSETAQGSLLWSDSQQVPLGDLFQLQDELTQRIVASIAAPLTARERRILRHDVPATAKAYEYYLRANQIAYQQNNWALARDLYLEALRDDPEYAPAWARLGRCHRLIGKYASDPAERDRELASAEEAFRESLRLNPDLGLAHNLYAQLETERGRPREAMTRLLERARLSGPDAEIFAGLVHALRYCGLLEESLAAHELAMRLDGNVRTSVEYTYFVLGRFEEAVAAAARGTIGTVREMVLLTTGDIEQAMALLEQEVTRLDSAGNSVMVDALELIRAAMHGELEQMAEIARSVETFPDAEFHFTSARMLAHVGATEHALQLLDRIVDGYTNDHALVHDPWFHGLHGHADFPRILERARAGRERALSSFLQLDGLALLARATP
jgi:class 3 adenylate cyclase/TolB-like protein/tetratricopeptide (TPR) repeat protein